MSAPWPEEPPADDPAGPPPPQDPAAEAAVLGALLNSPVAVADVAELLEPGDFYRPQHEQIYAAILGLDARGEPTGPVAVSAALARAGDLQRVGGAPYLHTLMSGAPTASNAAYYADLVAAKARLRRLAEAGTRLVQLAHQGPDPDEALAQARAWVDGCDTAVRRGTDRTVGELLADLYDDLDNPPDPASLVTTPWSTAELVIPPLTPGELVVVGARPSVGKSVVAVDWCRHVAVKVRRPAVLCSLEMGGVEVERRIVAAHCRVSLSSLTARSLGEDEEVRLAAGLRDLSDAPLIIDDATHVTVAHVRRLIRKHRPALIAVDYLGLMAHAKAASREQEVGETARQLKLLAKAEKTPILLLVQLNRGPEARADKKPGMADLRESGQLEAHADRVLLLHRPDMYDRDDRPGEVDVIAAKQRNGPTGTVTLGAQLHYSRFVDLAGGWR